MSRKISIPHVSWRDGRPRFEPALTLRKDGHKGHDLKTPDGSWMSEGQALDWSRAFTKKLKTDRKLAGNVKAMEREARQAPEVKSYTVADMMRDFLASVQVETKSRNTIRDYRQKTRGLENFHLWIQRTDAGELKLKEKRPDAKDRAIAAIWIMEAAGLTTPIAFLLYETLFRKRGNHTANAVLGAMGTAFAYCQKLGRIDEERKNPFYKLGKFTPKPKPRFGSPDEIAALIHAADGLGRHDVGDMIALGVWIGQRQGDRLKLTSAQLRGDRFVVEQGKTGAVVSIGIAPDLAKRLKASKARRKKAKIVNPHVVLDELNRWTPWQPFNADHYRHTFGEVRLEAAKACPSVLKLRDKDMRATAVIWLAQAGCTNTEIASITGHTLKTVDTILKHYWAHNEGQADTAMAKLIAWHQKQGA